jgi:hypothetical protein
MAPKFSTMTNSTSFSTARWAASTTGPGHRRNDVACRSPSDDLRLRVPGNRVVNAPTHGWVDLH